MSPAATPVPRGPTVLTLYTAADLLTGPGCPVCRYAAEAGDRYLTWFALEAHADPATITRLCSSLGMCPPHTRGLMAQPGAARRLTAVYRYLMQAARDRLDGRQGRLTGCPACEHDERATRSALETLIEGLADDGPVRARHLDLGALCVPHLQLASARGGHQVVAWLARSVMAAISASPASAGRLAGTDYDAPARAVLRQTAIRARVRPGLDLCVACRARSHAEHDRLARFARSDDRDRPDPRLVLCAGHLSDLVVLAAGQDVASLLTWQTASLVAGLTRWPASRRRRTGACAACLAAEGAERQALGELGTALRAAPAAPDRHVPLCIRHLLSLSAADRWAGSVAAPAAAKRAGALIAELDEAFSKGTWARRHEARGQETTAWRRAAAFLDGGVLGGCPPGEAG